MSDAARRDAAALECQHDFGDRTLEGLTPPTEWLLDNEDLLPRSGRALDVACGRGRHEFWLAERGLAVDAIDRNRERLRFVQSEADTRGLRVTTRHLDLESGNADLGRESYDLIVVVSYLHRPLFPALLRALRPGALLVYETFTRAQAKRGRPSNPDFLLESGELADLVAPLQVLREREGEFDGRDIASVIAGAVAGAVSVIM